MKRDLTDITVVMDRSGSMASCRDDAQGGINELVDKQKKESGAAVFSLVQFDTEYEFVHRAKPIAEVPAVELSPRGCTALLDAVGKAIVETGERLKAMPEGDRPGLVVFVIVTDGQENASREYKRDQIKQMIQHQQEAYQWQFTFLGANQDAFTEARNLGISLDSAANYVPKATRQMFAAASSNLSRMRASASAGRRVTNAYSRAERKLMSGRSTPKR